MDVKSFLASPESSLVSLGVSVSDAGDILHLANELSDLKSCLKIAKKNKAEVARQFSSCGEASAEREELILSMQKVSTEIKGIEAQLKLCETSLANLLRTLQPKDKQVDAELPPFIRISSESRYTGSYTVRELQASERASWNNFLSTIESSAYHQPVWTEIIKRSFGHPTRIWVAITGEGEILGGVPLTVFSSRLFGQFAVSMPYFNYGGIVSPWFNVAQDIISCLQTVCTNERLSHIELRSMQPNLAKQFSDRKASLVLKLPESEKLLDEQLGAKVRAQYKKTEEHLPRIIFGKLDLLEDFYRVFSQNMRDLGTPVYSKRWFANILSAVEVDSHVVVVYIADKPVSAGFLIGHNGMLEIPWASTVRQANPTNANMWMYRQILGHAIRKGYKFFDFGRSTREAGTFKFKKQWGAVPYTHYWYYLLPDGGVVPELNPDNPKYKLVIGLWKRLPVWLTRLVGPPIVANIP